MGGGHTHGGRRNAWGVTGEGWDGIWGDTHGWGGEHGGGGQGLGGTHGGGQGEVYGERPHALGGGAALVHCGTPTPTPPRRCGGAALLWTFGYLLFFRTLGVWGLPEPPPYANALQLLLTLKVGGQGGN